MREPDGVRLLLVEDDPTISDPLLEGLRREGFEVELAATGAAALAAGPVDLVLLDLGLPDLEGRVVCQELRASSNVPIIVVTARSDEIDRVVLLELGADDYVVKPFGFRELVARIRAVLRRVGQPEAATGDTEAVTVGALVIDRRRHVVSFDDEPIAVTPKEYDLLLCLALDAGAVKTREQLIARGLGRALVGIDQDARRPHRLAAPQTHSRRDRDRPIGRVPLHRPRRRHVRAELTSP